MPDTDTDTVAAAAAVGDGQAGAAEVLDDAADDISDAEVAAGIVDDDSRHLRIIVKRMAHLSEAGRAYLRSVLYTGNGDH